MADEPEDDLNELIRQLITGKCIVIMEKLSTDLDYIELDTSNQFYTNVIFHPKNLNKNLYLFSINAKYLFCWDEVPGEDNEKLKRFFNDDFGIVWTPDVEISKSNDDMTIHISEGGTSAEIKIIDLENEKVTLVISDGRTLDLKVKNEEGKRNIYNDNAKFEDDLNNENISDELHDNFKTEGFPLSEIARATKVKEDDEWRIRDREKIYIVKKEGRKLKISYYEYLIKKISERIRKKVTEATQNMRNEEIVLVPLGPSKEDDIRSYFLHDDINMWKMIERAKQNTNFDSERCINDLKKDQKVVAVSGNFIGESRTLRSKVEEKKAELVKVIFILGVSRHVKPKLDEVSYDEIIPIEKVLDSTDLLLNTEKVRR